MAVAEWVRGGNNSHRGCTLEDRNRVETLTIFFSAMVFISVLLGLMNFSDIVILCGRPNSCCQQNLKCL